MIIIIYGKKNPANMANMLLIFYFGSQKCTFNLLKMT